MSEPLKVDVFWSFRSPWSYLAAPRLRQWQDEYRLELNFRPVYPLAIRQPDFFRRLHPLWVPYFMKDLLRVADFLDLPCVWPNPDPIVYYFDDSGSRQLGEEQPYIHRLTRLGIVAAEMGHGTEFADEISRLIWGGTVNWHEGDHLALASEKAGLDLAALDKLVISEADRLESEIEKNQTDLESAGHWGVPTCAYRGEPFFGQDRLDLLLWRLKGDGLVSRV